MTTVDVEIRKPLRLGEVLAAAIRIFGRRPLEFLALGVLLAGAYVVTATIPFAGGLAVLAVSFTIAFAMAVRLVVGDRFPEALRRTGAAAPVLAALALVVAVPFYLGSAWLLLLIFAVAWLALTVFAIPAALVEDADEPSFGGRIAYALRRTVALARAEYLHAAGVVAALVIIYVLIGVLLALALFSFAENGQLAAIAIAQIVLAPFFFIGLSVLYFDQQARADAHRPGRS